MSGKKECCVDSDVGLSYSDNGNCSECIGKFRRSLQCYISTRIHRMIIIPVFCLYISTVHGFAFASCGIEELAFLDNNFKLNVKGTSTISGIRILGSIIAESGTASK